MAIDNPIPEEWRFVVGYELFYRVSSLGKIYSSFSNFILKPKLDRYGYHTVSITTRNYTGKRNFPITVHTLVCLAFHGPKPTPTHQVNHKDGVKTNNAASNLEWATPEENIRHAIAMGLMPNIGLRFGNHGSGSYNRNAKLTQEDVKAIRAMPPSITHNSIGEIYGVDESVIMRARSGQTYKEVPLTIPWKSPRRPVTEEVAREIRNAGTGTTIASLAKKYGISQSQAGHIRRGNGWRHI